MLEVMLAIGLCVIVALVSVPAMEGWWSEHKMRRTANEVIGAVQAAKLEAVKSGQSQMVVLGRPPEPSASPAPKNLRFVPGGPEDAWSVTHFGGGAAGKGPLAIRVDAKGYVEPATFRLTQGSRFLEFRFDFLTGYAREEAFSF